MKRSLAIFVILLVASVATYVLLQEKLDTPKRITESRQVESLPSSPPALLPAREATPESPLFSWERLLVETGSPSEDRAALQDIVSSYLQNTNTSSRLPLGPNEEFARALTDPDSMGDSAIPLKHPAILNGQLIDRWGTPWFLHQDSSGTVSTRSAGPDRKLFTPDDVTE